LAKIALAFFTSFPLSRTLPFGSAKVETFSAFPKPFSLLFFQAFFQFSIPFSFSLFFLSGGGAKVANFLAFRKFI
ncbi:hypothetical protein, partial [Mucilaginibacter sp.]|uniref:hypothetical protein n=1 Tax=Mucilaginibacter sp. TaxID=1882438 RepID=UPI0025E6E8BD